MVVYLRPFWAVASSCDSEISMLVGGEFAVGDSGGNRCNLSKLPVESGACEKTEGPVLTRQTDTSLVSRPQPGKQQTLAQSASSRSSVAERYALALFELALSEKKLEAVEKDLESFDEMIRNSEDLRRLIGSPVFSSDDRLKAIDAILTKAKISGLVGNFIKVSASNDRLFIMPSMLAAFRRLLARHNGEVTAEVTVASKLSAAQAKELKAALKSAVGKDVAIDETVDPSLLGGMIVKVGSRQIDTSLKSKLSSLKLNLKEAG